MVFPFGTLVTIQRLDDPFTGAVGSVVAQPSAGVRTVRLTDDDAEAIDRCYRVTELSGVWECFGCGDAMPEASSLCAACSTPVAA